MRRLAGCVILLLGAAAVLTVWLSGRRGTAGHRVSILKEARAAGTNEELHREPTAPSVAQGSTEAGPSSKLALDGPWLAAQFNQAYIRNESRYGHLFRALRSWPAEKREALKLHLAESDAALMRATVRIAHGQASSDLINSTEEANQRSLEASLGEDSFQQVQELMRAEAYRSSVQAIIDAMRGQDIVLDENKQELILSAYAAAVRESVAATTGKGGDDQAQAFRLQLMRRLQGILTQPELQALMETQMEQAQVHG